MDEWEKNDDWFAQWLKDTSLLEKACANGKTYMVNPAALSVVVKLMNFFKTKSDDHVRNCIKAGIDGEPYTIRLDNVNKNKPWFKREFLTIFTNDPDGIQLNNSELKELADICGDYASMVFSGTTITERISILIGIKDFYLEIKS